MKASAIVLIFSALIFFAEQNAAAQQKGTTSKSALVKEIVDFSVPALPVAVYQKLYDKARSDAPAFIKDQVAKSFPAVLARQTQISAARKKNLTADLPNLMIRIDSPINRIVAARFAGLDSLPANYLADALANFSTAEIIEINRFLRSKAGIAYLKQVKQISDNMTARKAKPLEIEERYRTETSAFLSSEPGTKYNKLFVVDVNEAVLANLKQTMTFLLEDFNKDAEVGKLMNAYLQSGN